MRTVAIITGSRGEYGYIKPIAEQIKQEDSMNYFMIATNMHLLSEFGYSLGEIKKDDLKVEEKIYNTFDGYNPLTMSKSLGVFLMQLPEILHRKKPDLILVSGDRGEQLMSAVCGAHMYIPVAHIQSGEVSGNIDGVTRHAITKFAHIHFCANEKFAERVKKMGEEKFRIFTTGAPQLDEIFQEEYTSEQEIEQKFNLSEKRPVFLLVYHPVTENYGDIKSRIKNLVSVVNDCDAQVVSIFPNSDAGSKEIREVIEEYKGRDFRTFRNLSRKDYLGIMNLADLMIGNSSSGIIESPIFDLPSVNIGRRQKDRLRSNNVIDVQNSKEEIKKAINKGLSSEFREVARASTSPYGDEEASRRIVRVLRDIEINDELLNKNITY